MVATLVIICVTLWFKLCPKVIIHIIGNTGKNFPISSAFKIFHRHTVDFFRNLFTHTIADFLCDNLTRIRHTTVLCQVFEGERKEIPLRTEKIEGTVASVRLDTLLALAWKTSRSSLVGMIEDGRVFVNGKCITSNGYHVKENDLISARGMGRFVYEGMLSQTKKGRYLVKLEKYV